jgi:hypothetical protein
MLTVTAVKTINEYLLLVGCSMGIQEDTALDQE